MWTMFRALGADTVIDYQRSNFEDLVRPVDAVLDLVEERRSAGPLASWSAGGILVSVVSPFPEKQKQPSNIRTVFFLVEVTQRLNALTKMFESGKLSAHVGSVVRLPRGPYRA